MAAPADTGTKLAIDRTLLAAERTLLAWLRTGISLITFGFLVARLGLWLEGQRAAVAELRHAGAMGALFVVLGTVANALATYRYMVFRKAALGEAGTPTSPTGLLAFGGSVVLLGALMGYFVLQKLR